MDPILYEQVQAVRTSVIELGAWISIWRDDKACNLTPTDSSLDHATSVYERALAECAALLETRQTKKETA